MGMAIDEAGREEPAAAIHSIAFECVGSYRFYDTVLDQHRALLDKAVAVDHGGDGKIGEEHGDSLLV